MPPSSVYIGRPSKFGNPDEIRKPIPKDPVTLNGIKYISEEVISNALTDEKKVYLRQYLENPDQFDQVSSQSPPHVFDGRSFDTGSELPCRIDTRATTIPNHCMLMS